MKKEKQEKKQEKKQKKEKKKQEKKEIRRQKKLRKQKKVSVMQRTTLVVMLFVVVVLITAWFQFQNIEEGVLDVCATQQDAYVQLVIDQINLKENRTNEQIISEILGTLDASSNKYWTFSQEEAMLFVKDVLETNKYKGLTTESYYNSKSASDFVDGLKLNSVTHGRISVAGKPYLASGVMFEYGGQQYRLCLLSNESVYLDNNRFLEAKTELWLIVIVALIILIVVSMGMASRIRTLRITSAQQEETIMEQNIGIAHLNDRLSDQNLYDAQNNLWHNKMLLTFLRRLCDRQVDPVALVTVRCDTERKKNRVLERTSYVFGKKVLRFLPTEEILLFVFVGCDKETAQGSIARILPWSVKVDRCVMMHGEPQDVDHAFEKLGLAEYLEKKEEPKEGLTDGN